MTPTITQTTPASEKAVEFAIGHRQMAAIGFVCFLLLGLVATLSYVAGRVAAPAPAMPTAAVAAKPQAKQVAAAPAAAVPAPRAAVEQLIVVDAPASAVGAAASTAHSTAGLEPPRQQIVPPVERTLPAAAEPAPRQFTPTPVAQLKGNTYLQVAAIDRGMADVTTELLSRKGLPALIGDSPSDGIFRVLVGPIREAADLPRHQAALEEAGFKPFVKKYF